MKIEIYSDIACPWCYLGDQRLEKALDSFEPSGEEVDLVYRPFQLDPNLPTEAVPMLDYLEGRFGPNGRRMADEMVATAARDGLEMDYERGLSVNTLLAHRLMWIAETQHGAEMQREVARRLFEAHFSGGRNVGDIDVLGDIATEAGMDGDAVRERLRAGDGVEEVDALLAHARTLGISVVPTFVINDRYAVQGAQPPEAFLQALQQIASDAG